MFRRTSSLLAVLLGGLLLTLSGFAQPGTKPGDKPAKAPEGSWKLVLPTLAGKEPLWLVRLEQKEGRWSGKLSSREEVGRSELSALAFKGGILRFVIQADNPTIGRLNFEVKVSSADASTLLGSAATRSAVHAVELGRTSMASLDRQELDKDTIANSKDRIAIIKAANSLVSQAGFRRTKPEEVRGWVDRALKAAEPYGERFQQDILLDMVKTLNEQDRMAAITLPYAKRAESLLSPRDRPAVRERTLELLAVALERAGKADEAREVTARLKKIDFSVVAEPYPPRGGKNERVVLMELFTGAECPPCVAADLAFDGLQKAFKPSEAILLQYHEHIPGPDPLTSADSENRMKYYAEAFGRQVGGTPSTVFNGKPAAAGGGGAKNAQDKYDQYHSTIVGRFEEAPGASIKLEAVRKGDKIDIKAEVADLKEPGDSVRLRLVLVEEKVAYKGGNGLPEHHNVVRSFPGGLEGTPLKQKTGKKEVSVDLGELRTQLKKYLQEAYKKLDEELPKDVPMELKKLRVIALVQDDNTREVLQAALVNVEAK